MVGFLSEGLVELGFILTCSRFILPSNFISFSVIHQKVLSQDY